MSRESSESRKPDPAEELPADESIASPSESEHAEEAIGNEADPFATLSAERDQLQNQLLRSQAELDNFRKRSNRERDEERKYAALSIIRDLLPAMDNLQRAIEAGQSQDSPQALLQGVGMVVKQFEEILSRHGAQGIAAIGEPFDPHVHEALQQQPTSEFPPMTVVRELEKGYRLYDRVIRPSKVIVAGPPAEGN